MRLNQLKVIPSGSQGRQEASCRLFHLAGMVVIVILVVMKLEMTLGGAEEHSNDQDVAQGVGRMHRLENVYNHGTMSPDHISRW